MYRSTNDVRILAGWLFDSYTGNLVQNRVITVSPDSGLIIDVDTFEDSDDGLCRAGIDLKRETTIDLRELTILPGFVDVRVHCKARSTAARITLKRICSLYKVFLHPYSETSWMDQVTRESLAERTIRATTHARRTLMAGYTTVR